METQASPGLPAMEYAERSDPGRDPDKQVNEDACIYRPTRFGHLCIVCDGMGGHAAGREAADLAVASVLETFEQTADGTPPSRVILSAIERANGRVFAMQTSEVAAGRPGSTLVAALMHAQGTEIAHVGDSRAYLVHGGQIFRMTRDHSIVQELVSRGLLTPQQAAHHPDANRITRALGIAAVVEADLHPTAVHHLAGDAFVLCSDGLSDLVEEHEILAIVGSEPAAQAVGKLVDLANARGGHDNITVVVLRARESALAPQTALTPTIALTSFPEGAALDAAAAPLAALAPQRKSPVTELSLPMPPRPIETGPALASPAASRSTAVLAASLVLACAAAALLGAALVVHLAERSGKRNTASQPALGVLLVDAGGGGGPTTLAPESVVLPSATGPAGEPIAPLEPGPAEPRKHKR